MPILRLTYDLSKRKPGSFSTQRHALLRCNELPVSVEGYFSSDIEAEKALGIAIESYISAAAEEGILDDALEEIGSIGPEDTRLQIDLTLTAARSSPWTHQYLGPSLGLGRIRHPDRLLARIGCRHLQPRNGYTPLVREIDGRKIIRLVDAEAFEVGDFGDALKGLGYLRSDFEEIWEFRKRQMGR